MSKLVVPIGAAALSAAGLACGAADNASAFPSGDFGDSGSSDDSSAAGDISAADATAPIEAAGADASGPMPTAALFVHAAADLPDLRLCWYHGSTPSPVETPFPTGAPAPASNYPALAVGGAVALPDASELLGSDLTLVGISASELGQLEQGKPSIPSCYDRLQTNSGTGILGYSTVFTFHIPTGALVAGATNVIALTGCHAGEARGAGACGAGYDAGAGNLHADVLPLFGVSEAGAGQLPVQAAQLSPALAALAGGGGAVVVSFGAQGASAQVASLEGEGVVAPLAATYLDAGTDPHDYGRLGFGVDIAGADGGAGHLWMSLEQSLALQSPTKDPALYYAQQTTFLVAVVGDPGAARAFAPDAAFDGTGLHVLVLPLL